MIRRPPRSTLSSSSAASDVYKRQVSTQSTGRDTPTMPGIFSATVASTVSRAMRASARHQPFCTIPVKEIASVLKLNVRDEATALKLDAKMKNMTEPVSYTHLRAHETPEHLVCRLLLEKKKKNVRQNQ
eukprot:TRINITY_DN23935_c0_g1_i3.p1 TRINITY_DN23935_c0_g1~~TRINITY_DN23935_c0_g1_i3.p1  ORF type:complete len:129 (+),score=41.59 TRINITY_DN23935_c0_g1_i3:145-531(+)